MIDSYSRRTPTYGFFLVGLLFLFVFAALSACSASSASSEMTGMDSATEDMADMDHTDMDHTDMDHTDSMAGMDHGAEGRKFVPNDGAEVHIMSPKNEAVFTHEDGVPVIIGTTNFTIGEEGRHWHIYVDGDPIMVMGGTTFVLQDLAPGAHEIEVYLSLGTHEDLQQGDKVSITVAE